MKSTKIQPRQNGVNPKRLNTQEMLFVHTMAADINFNAIQAVKECYPRCKNASSQVAKLLSRPHVQKMLSVVLRKRLERLELKADDVLEYLRFALFFNPLDYFFPTEDGMWTITDLKSLPKKVGSLICGMKVKTKKDADGSEISTFEVDLISKATALSLAMKHVGLDVEKPAALVQINWDALSQGQVIDIVEQRLIEEDKK